MVNEIKINLDTKVQFLKGVGPSVASKLNKLGIETARDLLYNYPRRYEDYTKITKISDLQYQVSSIKYKGDTSANNQYTIRGTIIGIANKRTSRRGFTVTEAVVEDGTGTLKVVWFNQPFLEKMLVAGTTIILNGKVGYNSFTHEMVMESPNRAKKPCIVPVYCETAGISSYYIQKLVSNIKYKVSAVEEYLPEDLIEQYKLLGIKDALLNIHFPESSGNLKMAERRIAFDELFFVSLRANLSREKIKKEKSFEIHISDEELASFVKSLPFELTLDQKKSAWQVVKDMRNDSPMNRLLNGDVGSGKTVVAAIAAFVAARAGFRTVFMVPTSILASQHFETFKSLFKDKDISIGLYTRERQELVLSSKYKVSRVKSSKSKKNLNTKYEILNSDLIIGTQALIQKDVEIENIGLVVVDEQHRFGVNQRQAIESLSSRKYKVSNEERAQKPCIPAPNLFAGRQVEDRMSKVESELPTPVSIQSTTNHQPPTNLRPHFLSMTATPIPRTLHLALFGDLDISVIKEKPKNRKEIRTQFVMPQNRQKSYDFIRTEIKDGRQAFVICPLIENANVGMADNLFEEDRKSVLAEYKKLSEQIFPDLKMGILHGKMKAIEKDNVMAKFVSGELNILVSTSVVEVGVDVPNATVMMIEDAERFGLAQIHQFRGRVGRAEHQSYCFLFSSTMSPRALSRLESLENTLDGFRLAEIDLETRGPGEIFGTMQSGDFELKMASMSDRVLIEEASNAAKNIMMDDPDLIKYPKLSEQISKFLQTKHLE